MSEKKNLNFEEKISKLNEIVENISNKALPLDEAIKLYEEGNQIVKELDKALKDAEKEIKEVIEIKSNEK